MATHDTRIINLKLFRYKNFAICCFLMMLVGGVLNANTVLQPQFMQQLLGYNATTAGLALTAGGIALVIVMPMAGFATGKISARTLAVVGFILFIFTFRYAADVTSLDMSFAPSLLAARRPDASAARSASSPSPTRPTSACPRRQSNQVAGLINFVRNIGGSILIAITGAQVTNRSSSTRPACRSTCKSGNPQFVNRVNDLGKFFGNGADGTYTAKAYIYQLLNQQAGVMGYQDVYRMLAWMACIMVLFAFLLKKNRPGQGPAAAEAMR